MGVDARTVEDQAGIGDQRLNIGVLLLIFENKIDSEHEERESDVVIHSKALVLEKHD